MIYTNAFFQMLIRDDGVYIKYFPPKRNGKDLDLEELINYLNGQGVAFDVEEFKKLLASADAPALFKTAALQANPASEKVNVRIDNDGMRAFCRFIPPTTGGRMLSKGEILSAVKKAGVVYGIDETVIDKYIENRQFCTDYVIAGGKKQIEGSNARIVYKFNTDINAKPKRKEDGSVDFHSLDIISAVKEGDVLAELIKEKPGVNGMDIRGKIIKPLNVKPAQFKYGKNVSLSEDGTRLISDITGHVVLVGGAVAVSNTFVVENDVDMSTGNIKYDGDVEVKGNVTGGFVIEAAGDVIVGGTVEDSEITANGRIILKGGIRGRGKGKISSGESIIAKFLENVTVFSGGSVTADAIIGSDVSAKGDVVVEGNRGYINGGTVRSATLIRAKNAGSEMGMTTNLEVGVDPHLLADYKKCQSALDTVLKRLEANSQLVELYSKKINRGEKLPQDRLEQFKAVTLEYKEDASLLEKLQEKFVFLSEEIAKQDGGSIEVAGNTYPGVKILIVDTIMYVRDVTKNTRFTRSGADIKSEPLN